MPTQQRRSPFLKGHNADYDFLATVLSGCNVLFSDRVTHVTKR